MKKKFVLSFVTGYLVYSAVYVCQSNLSVATPALQSKGMMTKAQIEWFGNVLFTTYSPGQLFNGCLGDRLKARSMIHTSLLLIGICNVMAGALPPFAAIFVLWAINGYAQSMVWGPSFRTVSTSSNKEKGRCVTSLLISSMVTGSAIGIMLASFSVSMLGIHFASTLLGCVTLVARGVVVLLFRAEEPVKTGKRSLLKQLFLKPEILLVLLPAMIHGVLEGNISLWAPPYFMQTSRTSILGVTFCMLIIPVISLVGRLIYPVVYRVCHGRKHPTTMLTLNISGIALMSLYMGTGSMVSVTCLSLVAAAIPVVNTSILNIHPMDFKKDGLVSSVAGIMDFATYMEAGISSAIYGYALEYDSLEMMYVSWIVLCLAGIMILVRLEGEYGYEKISDSG